MATDMDVLEREAPSDERILPLRRGPVPGTPRWAVAAAYATLASVVPSGIWRSLVGLGVDLGWSQEHLRLERIPGFGTWYVLTLTVLSISGATLTLGLVYRWGEVAPGWLPVVGGRRLPVPAVVGAAAVGVLVTAAIVVASVLHWPQVSGFADRPRSGWARLMVACYLPAGLWPPLLAAVTVAYWRRRASS